MALEFLSSSPSLFCGFAPASIQLQPVHKPHGHEPRLTVAPVKYCGRSIVESLRVPHSLCHSLSYIQLLHTLGLNVDTRQPSQIGNRPIAERTAPLNIVAMFMEQGGKLPLAVRSFSLQ